METIITQKDYIKFYEDIMELVNNGRRIYPITYTCYCKPPGLERVLEDVMQINDHFCKEPKTLKESIVEQEISLSDRILGNFIDEQFKLTFIRVRSTNNEEMLDMIKNNIAFIIRAKHNSVI